MLPVSVLVVDDHPVVRQGIVAMLATDPEIHVVGVAGDGAEALAQVRQCAPRIVLMDVHMPGMDGLTATKKIKESCPRTAVVVLTLFTNDAYVVEAIHNGAAGYLLKNTTREDLCATLKAVSRGGVVIQTTVLQQVLAGAVSSSGRADGLGPDGAGGSSGADGETMTERERAVLRLVVEGLTNKEIGRHLSIKEDTVKKHIQNLLLKLQVSDRTQAAVTAVRRGLVC